MSNKVASKALLSGSFWTGIGTVANGMANLAAGIIAARILEKHDFGLMRTAILWLTALEFFSQTGFDAALIQKKKDFEKYLDVAWTWHVMRGAVICGLLCAAAPLLSRWYDEPILLPLIVVSASSAVLMGVSNIGTLCFTRELKFRTLFLIKIGYTLLRVGLFIPAIFYFQNVWALAVSHVGGAAAHLIVSYVSHPYRPRLTWDRKRLGELINYGKWITGMAIIGYVIGMGDDLFISKYLGIIPLGIYLLSYDVSNMPTTSITHVIGRVGLPVYARLQSDAAELKAAFTNVMRATMLLSGPVSVFIYLSAPDLVAQIITKKWEATIPLIRVLVISGFIRSFAALAGPLFQATGRPDLDFKMNLPRFLSVALLIWPFSAWWGLRGVCFVVLIAIVTTLPTWIYGVRLLTKLRVSEVVRHNALAWVGSGLLAGCYLVVRPRFGDSFWEAIGGNVASIVVWVAALLLLGKLTPWSIVAEARQLRDAMSSK